MHRALMLPLAVTLTACSATKTSTGEDYFTDWACDAQPWDWYNDPVGMVLATDEDGDFDLDPSQSHLTGISGSYDFEDGDIEWTTSYLDAFYLEGSEAEGFGTVSDDGDIDLLWRTMSRDVLGVEEHTRVRAERSGCTETRNSWTISADADLAATPSEAPFELLTTIESDSRVQSTATLDGGYDYQRVATDDLHTVTTITGSAYDYEATSYGDGTADLWQESSDGDFDQRLEVHYKLDGGQEVDSRAWVAGTDELYQECSYTSTYAGEGSGTCSYYTDQGDFDCALSFDADSCVLECGDAGTYDC